MRKKGTIFKYFFSDRSWIWCIPILWWMLIFETAESYYFALFWIFGNAFIFSNFLHWCSLINCLMRNCPQESKDSLKYPNLKLQKSTLKFPNIIIAIHYRPDQELLFHFINDQSPTIQVCLFSLQMIHFWQQNCSRILVFWDFSVVCTAQFPPYVSNLVDYLYKSLCICIIPRPEIYTNSSST